MLLDQKIKINLRLSSLCFLSDPKAENNYKEKNQHFSKYLLFFILCCFFYKQFSKIFFSYLLKNIDFNYMGIIEEKCYTIYFSKDAFSDIKDFF